MFIAMLVSVFVLSFIVPSAILRALQAIIAKGQYDGLTDCLIVASCITVIVAYFTKYHIAELMANASTALQAALPLMPQ